MNAKIFLRVASLTVGMIISICANTAQATPLSFDQALDQIIARSTALETQKTNVGFAEANSIPAKFQFLPSVILDASKTRSETANSDTTTNTGVEAVAKYNLIHWGADVANLRAANSDVRMQKSTYETTRFNTEDAGVSALVNEIENLQTIDVNVGIVEIQTNLLKVARARFEKGYLASQEVDKILVDLDNAQASLADARVQEVISRANLENYLGQADIVTSWPWKDRFFHFKTKLLEQTLNLQNHPDYLASENKDQAENQRYSKTKGLLLPSLDANFTYGYYNGFDSLSGYSYSSGALSPSWTAGLTLTWTIFDHLTSYADEHAQANVAEAADVALVQKERDLKEAWEASKNNFQIALNAAIAREKTLDTSRKIYQDSLRRVQAGRISANDFVIDQKRLFDSELFAVQGWANAHLQFPKLCHSLGLRLDQCWDLEKN
jgi:outer membrane protein TolC